MNVQTNVLLSKTALGAYSGYDTHTHQHSCYHHRLALGYRIRARPLERVCLRATLWCDVFKPDARAREFRAFRTCARTRPWALAYWSEQLGLGPQIYIIALGFPVFVYNTRFMFDQTRRQTAGSRKSRHFPPS